MIPKGCGVLINIYSAHRNPEQWEKPDHFHPDHFLPEAVKNRNPFSYVPFSAGPRSCVGKLLPIFLFRKKTDSLLSVVICLNNDTSRYFKVKYWR